MTEGQETVCGLKIGDEIPPGPDSVYRCDALTCNPADGSKFLLEMGLPDDKRTQVVGAFNEIICVRNVEGKKGRICPACSDLGDEIIDI